MRFVDNFLNSITMYRLVLYGLAVLALFAFGLSLAGVLNFTPLSLILSAATLIAVCYASNYIFAKLFSAPTNAESSLITALILFLILTPSSAPDIKILALAGIIAMASKYLFAPFRRHVFNPAAFGAAVIFFAGLGGASWWVGGPVMLFPVLIAVFLFVRKIKRFLMFFSFLAAWLITLTATGVDLISVSGNLIYFGGSILFFGALMLTEPITTPPTKKLQIIYGILVGALLNLNLGFSQFALTPEIVLLAGNIFSYATGFQRRLVMTLIERREIAKNIIELTFAPDKQFSFAPGQYLEWTLLHASPDARGVRRFFTIASSPTEKEIKLGVKLSAPSSSFKKELSDLKSGERVFAGQLAGDFTLPRDKNRKLAFIAGGIGITPYRSMIKYLIDKKERRDIFLLYAIKKEEEIAYRYLFIEAESKIGLKAEYVLSKLIDSSLMQDKLPDWRERIFYVSGPDAMVRTHKIMLRKMGVARKNILTDYFPGYA